MRHFQSILFHFVVMDVISIKLKCRYIILPVTAGGIILLCDFFVDYCGNLSCLLFSFYTISFDLTYFLI